MKFSKILRRGAVAVMAVALLTVSPSWAGTVEQLPTIRVNGKIMYYYDTQSGDNIYTIADKLGISVKDIRANNPSVSDGIKPRMRLFFPTDIQTSAEGDSRGPLTHVVVKGESVYGIARQHGLTMDELIALNPFAKDGIKPGMRLRLQEDDANAVTGAEKRQAPIPAEEDDRDISAGDEIAEETDPSDPAAAVPDGRMTEPDPVAGDSLTVDKKEMNVAIILPFLLNEETVGRQTQLYTEFYKGFLLAADSLNLPGRTPVRLHAYDSSASLDSVRAIMSRPEMALMDLIIAPDNTPQLDAIAHTAPENAWVLNVFAVKDSSYMTMPGMIQTNIPHNEMYDHAIEGFLDCFPSATPVFLVRKGGRTDKEEFADRLKYRLDLDGRIHKTVTFDGYLADADLAEFNPDTESFVFIPVSGSRDEFTRVLHAIKAFKERALNPDAVQVFGYPEWTTFRESQFDEICDLGTTIYSRYSPVERDPDAIRVNGAFRNTYGEGVLDKQMPVLGILGFDTGMMVIEGLRAMAETDYFPSTFSGIQSGIRLEQAGNDGGLFNNALFIITYRPGGHIEKILK